MRPELTLALARRGMREAFAYSPLAEIAEQLVELGLPRGD